MYAHSFAHLSALPVFPNKIPYTLEMYEDSANRVFCYGYEYVAVISA